MSRKLKPQRNRSSARKTECNILLSWNGTTSGSFTIYMRRALGKLFSLSNLMQDSRFQLILLPEVSSSYQAMAPCNQVMCTEEIGALWRAALIASALCRGAHFAANALNAFEMKNWGCASDHLPDWDGSHNGFSPPGKWCVILIAATCFSPFTTAVIESYSRSLVFSGSGLMEIQIHCLFWLIVMHDFSIVPSHLLGWRREEHIWKYL